MLSIHGLVLIRIRFSKRQYLHMLRKISRSIFFRSDSSLSSVLSPRSYNVIQCYTSGGGFE